MQETINFCNNWLAAWSGNQPEKLISFYGRDAFYRDPAKPLGLRGHQELLFYFKKLLSRNPNWVWKAVEIFSTEKGFILKWEATIPLKDKIINETGMDIVELNEGKIVRNEVYFDTAGMK